MSKRIKAESRRQPRQPLSGRLLILWEDEGGRERVSPVKCVDVSATGAKFQLMEKIPARTPVTFNCPELGIAGRGTVRYSDPARAGYEIGIECLGGTGWRNTFEKLRSGTGLPEGSGQLA